MGEEDAGAEDAMALGAELDRGLAPEPIVLSGAELELEPGVSLDDELEGGIGIILEEAAPSAAGLETYPGAAEEFDELCSAIVDERELAGVLLLPDGVAALAPPPPPQAVVNSGATNDITNVAFRSLRCQLKVCFSWRLSI